MGHSTDTDKDIVYDFPFTVAPLSQTVSANTWTNQLEVPSFVINLTTPGTNKIAEYACMTHDSDAFWEVKQYSNSDLVLSNGSYVEQIECFMGCYVARTNPASLTATDYIGIEYGSIDSAPPLPTTPTAGGVAQLRWIASSDSFELFTAKGDGSAGVRVPLHGVTNTADSGGIPHGVFARLEIDNTRRIVNAYINGILGATYKGDAFPSEPISHQGPHQLISGIFMTTGTVTPVGGRKAYFSNFKHRLKGAKNFPSSSIGEQVPR